MHTFLWHDYETFGANTRTARPAQFAAIRTDSDLNIIGEPINWHCKPAADFLPEPQACLITGITPQRCLQLGMPEPEFAKRIVAELATPNTIGVGYNSIRFDDEITRFMLWRNLQDPYAREWQNGCGRWDLLDVVRACYALRPDGIVWPRKEDGTVSFKLEDLAKANGFLHERAHDALSDVRVLIDVARLIKTKQPRLFDFCLGLHKKDRVRAEIGELAQPFLHVSGMFSPAQGCIALMWPLGGHPTNSNEVIAWDLRHDPSELATLSADEVRTRLFSKADELPEGVSRLPIKTIHINKSPVVVHQLKTLRPDLAAKWGIDFEQQALHHQAAKALPDLRELWAQVFERPAYGPTDVDSDLYGGFISPSDRRKLDQLRSADFSATTKIPSFEDDRLGELVLRYRARNHPDTLTPEEQNHWMGHLRHRLIEGTPDHTSLEAYQTLLDELMETTDDAGQEVLSELYDYAMWLCDPLM